MAISTDYPSPVTVNGFTCRNCTDVDYAKKHIDPAHPASGPFGINDSTKGGKAGTASKAAIAYDRAHPSAYTASAQAAQSNAIGGTVDVQA